MSTFPLFKVETFSTIFFSKEKNIFSPEKFQYQTAHALYQISRRNFRFSGKWKSAFMHTK
jgi:hypothetical protein